MSHLTVQRLEPKILHRFEQHLKNCGFILIGKGATRLGYRRKQAVVKVPYNAWGFQDNIVEAYAYYKYRKQADPDTQFVFAPCRLLPNACLLMVYVKRQFNRLPNWSLAIDNIQCGKYKDRIVAYDSATDIFHLHQQAFQWAGLKREHQ